MSDAVTGEAVVVDLRPARLPSRALGLLLDVTVQLATLLGLVLLAGRLLQDADPALAAAVQLVLIVAVLVGYPVTAETLFRGRTLGKAALGLRVVRDDGGPIRFRQALVRGLLGFFVDLWLTAGIGAVVAATVSGRGKRVGDLLAGTLVVRDRAPAAGGPAPAMPHGLAGWAAVADLSRVDDRLAVAARQVLDRRRQLAPEAYASLCRQIASAVAALVSPHPPPGTPPDAYLGAVLAERRRRATARLGANGPAPRPPVAVDGTAPRSPTAVGGPAPADTRPPDAEPARPGGFALPG